MIRRPPAAPWLRLALVLGAIPVPVLADDRPLVIRPTAALETEAVPGAGSRPTTPRSGSTRLTPL